MTHKTISVTMANDDAFALFEIGAAFQRIAQRHGLEAPAAIPHEEAKVIMAERKAEIRKVLNDAEQYRRPSVTDADKAQLAALGEAVEMVEAAAPALMSEELRYDGEEVMGPRAEPTDSPQLDADGLPWDARIHSDSRARNADDAWRARRKPKDMDEAEWSAYVSDTRAELKRVMELPVEPHCDPDKTDHVCNNCYSDQGECTSIPVEPEPIVVVPPPPAPAPVETVVPPAPVDELPTDFIGVLQWLTGNGWKGDVVDPVLAHLSLGRLQDLQARPDTIPAFCAEVLKGV